MKKWNTAYFHHKASQRKKRNYIHGVKDKDGVWQTEQENIEREVDRYFDTIFTSSDPSRDNLQEVLKYVRPSVTQEYNDILIRPYTKEEIYAALSDMHPCKAPGPDGMHAIFYQRFWHIIGDEVFTYISTILHNFSCPGDVNCTNIALIPKVKSPTLVSEFRPISLCNVLYKIASKALVLRLKQFLPVIVTENQSAFVPGRMISDNSLIALEIFHTMKRRNNSRKGLIAMKLDMSKAYDRVEWGFLRKLLLTMGFDGRWVNLVMSCVSTVSYSFVINGRVCGSVTPSRGLRQGDPLSPFLFILVADAFSQMIQQKVATKEIHGARASRNGPEISHLLFADDNRMWKKLRGWKEKLLSRAGKEVLIKAVIQALPTYLMGVYKLPVAVIQEIHSAMARFWWGGRGDERKMHWLSWEKMCKPKCMGGLGFKDLAVFNDALLGKQVWRLLHYKKSLLSRVMSAKYYPHGDVCQARLGYSSSYSWRSIWGAKSLVMEGLIWRVGDGMKIDIWSAPWVGDEEGRFIKSARVEGLEVVGDLLDVERREWNTELIDRYFNERDQHCIMAIPLSARWLQDELTWAYSKDGTYSVKTAYMLGKGGNLDDFHRVWNILWNLNVSPKVRHFMWRACTSSLPVREVLKRRHLVEEAICPCCAREDETQSHLFYSCSMSLKLWEELGCYMLLQGVEDEAMCDTLVRWSEMDANVVQKGCYILWNVWVKETRKCLRILATPLLLCARES
ncbi:uncharacterized protein LOC130590851 [Beta vulgaris subsp. vulgaris]|uniref:uncharacterized protein LOC130590851 n=1 Tax=Beta vulgaris subsp. vulgaris TaxID=3555 RepID=UPI002546E57B|nr:uncharacterized protein LOC130590851 [Beta vulgaris subsp. vulgaris]